MFFFDAVVVIRVHFSLEGGREVRVREMHYRYLSIYLSKTFLILILMFYLGGGGHILDFFFFFLFFLSQVSVSVSGSSYV